MRRYSRLLYHHHLPWCKSSRLPSGSQSSSRPSTWDVGRERIVRIGRLPLPWTILHLVRNVPLSYGVQVLTHHPRQRRSPRPQSVSQDLYVVLHQLRLGTTFQESISVRVERNGCLCTYHCRSSSLSGTTSPPQCDFDFEPLIGIPFSRCSSFTPSKLGYALAPFRMSEDTLPKTRASVLVFLWLLDMVNERTSSGEWLLRTG